MSIAEDSLNFVLERLRENHGATINYVRGLQTIESITAVVQEHETQTSTERGIYLEARIRDFVIAAEDLDFGAGPVEPLEGDEIVQTIAGKTHTYQVAPLGEQHETHKPYDQFGKAWCVFTQLKSIT